MTNPPAKYLFLIGFLFLFCSPAIIAQNPKPVAKKETPKAAAAKPLSDKQVIDSLQQVISIQNNSFDSLADLYTSEKAVTADLREQLIKIDDYRKKLEETISSFKGENLKLNQSNRILIVFNSLVAVLLITSLIFFLRKIGKKKNPSTDPVAQGVSKKTDSVRFTNFEDKLQQLERLGKLREKNLLSDDEFMVEKQRILGK